MVYEALNMSQYLMSMLLCRKVISCEDKLHHVIFDIMMICFYSCSLFRLCLVLSCFRWEQFAFIPYRNSNITFPNRIEQQRFCSARHFECNSVRGISIRRITFELVGTSQKKIFSFKIRTQIHIIKDFLP